MIEFGAKLDHVRDMERLLLSDKKYRAISGMTLNRLVYLARLYAVNTGMKKRVTVRSKGLLRKHFQYQRTKTTLPIAKQIVYYGSIMSPRFTGWIEQQFGKKTRRERTATPAARGKAGKRIIARRFRHNALNRMPRREVVPIQNKRSDAHHTAAMLAILKRRGYTGPLYIGESTEGEQPFLPGIYQMLSKGKVRPIQLDRDLQPKRDDWATKLQVDFLKQVDVYDAIARSFVMILKNK